MKTKRYKIKFNILSTFFLIILILQIIGSVAEVINEYVQISDKILPFITILLTP
mgnify:CR=1 FL=1